MKRRSPRVTGRCRSSSTLRCSDPRRPEAHLVSRLIPQLRAVPEVLERFGIGERLEVLHRPAVNDVAHGELDDLVRLGAGNIGHLHDFRRHVPRGGVRADPVLDLCDERVIEREPLAELHEQHHAHVADLPRGPGLADGERLHHLVQLLHLPVNLGGADAHAARIEHRVRPAVDDHAFVRGDLAPVAVGPDAGIALEIRGAVFLPVGVVPEPDRHRREGPRADELPLAPFHRTALVVEHLDFQAERLALDLAAPYRQDGIPKNEAAADIGAARDRREAQVALDRPVYVVEALGRERRSRREHGAQVLELVRFRRRDARLGARVEEFRRGAEVRDAFGVGEVEEDPAVSHEGRAVVEQQGRPRGKPRHQPVPHHPAERREVKEPIAGLHVAVQLLLAQVLEQRPALPMHDALRRAGGARGEEDVQRMVEGQLLEADFSARLPDDELIQALRARDGRYIGPRAHVGHDDDTPEAREARGNVPHPVERAHDLAVVEIAVGGEEHGRPDLAETVEHALHAEIGRGRGQDRAQARDREHHRRRLGHIGKVGGDAVAGLHAQSAQRLRRARHEIVQLAVRQASLHAVLAPEHDRGGGIAPAQQILGEVEPRIWKPLRPGHPVAVQKRALPLAARAHAGESPQRLPELLRPVGRPAVEIPVGVDAELPVADRLARETREVRLLDELLPGWKDLGAPLKTPVSEDRFLFLTESGSFKVPDLLLPECFRNGGNYVISLGNLCRWLGTQAESLGVEIYPGFAAAEVLYDGKGGVRGVATGEMGVGRDGKPTDQYQQGMELCGKYTFFAEGCRGHLGRQLMERYRLNADSDPQVYGIGLKELWEIDPQKHLPGLVIHSAGWPLDAGTYGGSFLYHMEDRLAAVGFVVGLSYANPYLDPYWEFQRYKTHPHIRKFLEGGKRISYGARAITAGGVMSLPKLIFPGGCLVGDDAGFLNTSRIKGSHAAIKSGMLAAEAAFAAVQAGRSGDELDAYPVAFGKSWLFDELYRARNFKQWMSKGLDRKSTRLNSS